MRLSSRNTKRLYAVRESMWFTPTVMALVGAIAALVLPLLDARLFPPDGQELTVFERFTPGPSAAESLLSVGVGALATILGVALSMTIVTLQLAAVQYTSRIIRRFMADQFTLLTLGAFLATITYLAVLLQAISTGGEGLPAFVPPISFTLAVFLFVGCVLLLAYFSHHVAQSIQTGTVLAVIGKSALREVRKYEVRPARRVLREQELRPEECVFVTNDTPGYIQLIDERRLLSAIPMGCTIQVEATTGRFMLPGRPLVSIAPKIEVTPRMERKVRQAFAIARERTIHQDVLFGVRQLVDIVLKALSPAINDVTTALMGINELGVITAEFARREQATRAGYSVVEQRGRRLLIRRLDLETLLAHAFDEIPDSAQDHPLVLARLLEVLNEVIEVTHLPAARKLLLETGARIARTTDMAHLKPWEAELVRKRFRWLSDGRDDLSWDPVDPI